MFYTEPNFEVDREKLAKEVRELRASIKKRKRNNLITMCKWIDLIFILSLATTFYILGFKEVNFAILIVGLLVNVKLNDWRIK